MAGTRTGVVERGAFGGGADRNCPGAVAQGTSSIVS